MASYVLMGDKQSSQNIKSFFFKKKNFKFFFSNFFFFLFLHRILRVLIFPSCVTKLGIKIMNNPMART